MMQIMGPKGIGNEVVEYVNNIRGNPQLVVNGFPFHRHEVRNGTSYWRCVQAKSSK